MSRHRLYHFHPKELGDKINGAQELAMQIHQLEKELVDKLVEIDRHRFYVRVGYNSLMGFCNFGLKFSRTQSQRIVTQVRRMEPTVNLEH